MRSLDAIRMSLAMTVAALVSVALHVDGPFWPVAIVFILVATHFEGSLERAFWRTMATISGALIGLAVTWLTGNDKGLFVVALFCVTSVSLYFYLTSVHAYAFLVQGITAYLVILYSIFTPEQVWSTAYYRVIEMVIGIAITLLFNKLFRSLHPANLLLHCMDQIAQCQSKRYLGESCDPKHLLGKAQEYLTAVTDSTRSPPFDPTRAQLLIDRQWDLYREITQTTDRDPAVAECIAKTNVLREMEAPQIPEGGELCFVLTEIFRLPSEPVSLPRPRRFSMDALKQAIRLGISAVVTLVLWLISGWAGAAFGVVTALMAGVERNMYSTLVRAGQSCIGALLGVGLGLFALGFCIHDLFSWTLVMLVGFYFFGWLALGPPNVQFIGLQGGFAFILSTVTSNSMVTNIEVPTQRLAGMLMGLVVTIVCAYLLWPVDVRKRLEQGLRANFARARELIFLRRGGKDPKAVLQALADQHRSNLQLAACTRDESLQTRLRLQGELLLHMEAIGRDMDLAKVAPLIDPELILASLQHLADGKIPDLEALQRAADELIDRLRAEPDLYAFFFYVRQFCMNLRETGLCARLSPDGTANETSQAARV